jgi:hypothetical protein
MQTGKVLDRNGKETHVTYEALKRYGNATYEPPRSAGEVVDEKVRRLRAQHPGLSYTECMHRVLDDPENATLKIAYAQESGGVHRS